MPNWKKVVTSGSNAHLNHITASGVISASGKLFAENITSGPAGGSEGGQLTLLSQIGGSTNWNVDPTGDATGMHDITTGTAATDGADNAANGIGAPHQNGGTLTFHSGRLGLPTNTLAVMGNETRAVYKPKNGTTA